METTQVNHAYWRGWLLLLVGILMPFSAMADEVTVADSNGNGLRYTYDSADGPATFIGVKTYSADADKAGRIVIADRVTDANGNGHDVLYIGGSLSNRGSIVSVVFGKNIVAVGGPEGTSDNAFYYCSNLQSVTLNSKLEILGNYTFQYCRNLTSINLSDATSLQTIKKGCFYNTDALRTVSIPASVKTIEGYAFYSIDSLRTLNISNDVSGLTIGEYAFSEDDYLDNVSLPAGVTTLEKAAFRSCDHMKSFTFAA